MRKIPNYNLTQELSTQLMMFIVIIGYIAYDQMDRWGMPSYIILSLSALAIFFLMRRQFSNITLTRILIAVKTRKKTAIKQRWGLFIGVNLLILTLTGFHFYLWYAQGKSLMPLVNEYGIGVLLSVVLFLYNQFNFHVMITDHGIAVGSKFDLKLISWKEIQAVRKEGDFYYVLLKNSFSIVSVCIPITKETGILKQYVSIKN